MLTVDTNESEEAKENTKDDEKNSIRSRRKTKTTLWWKVNL